MQSFHVSVPVLNQPANFAAVVTEGRGSIDESRPTDTRRTDAGGESSRVRWILLAESGEFFRIDFGSGSGPAGLQQGNPTEGRGQEVSAGQGVRNGRGEAERIGGHRGTYTRTRVCCTPAEVR